jgi:hypothetical protein
MKHEWKSLEDLLLELEYFIAINAPSHIVEKAALAVGAARIAEAIEQDIINSYKEKQ